MIQNNSGPAQGLVLRLRVWSNTSATAFAMTSDTRQRLITLAILTIASVCGLLFIAATREVGLPLWSVPAMTLFALSGLTLLCILPFAGDPRRFKDFGRLPT